MTQKKKQYLEELSKLSDTALGRLVELSRSAKLRSYFENTLLYSAMKIKLKQEGLM